MAPVRILRPTQNILQVGTLPVSQLQIAELAPALGEDAA